MKKLLLGTVSIISFACAGLAMAADLPAKAPVYKAALAPPLYNWTGFYVGVYDGGGWGQHNHSNVFGSNSYNSSGGLIGVTAGYNWQFSNPLVIGLEGDLAWANIKGDDAGSGLALDESRYRWLGSVRGRLGYAANNWLFFGTGGWAFANIRHTSSSGLLILTTDSFDNGRNGWTLGGGVEYAFLQNWTARVDYRYYDFGTYTRAAPTNGIAPYSVANKLQTVTVGVSYKF
jgi:outer membrane immunogenic protein